MDKGVKSKRHREWKRIEGVLESKKGETKEEINGKGAN
jgi:hypothetical protein